jgi:hypothetical protein
MKIAEIVRRAPFPLYGLVDALDDVRWVAQHDSLPSHLVLGHGDPRVEPERWVKVGVVLRDPGALFAEFSGVTIDIREWLGVMHAGAEGLAVSRDETLRNNWEEAQLLVDGVDERFEILGTDEHWIAYREEPDTWLFVHSRRVSRDTVELVRVAPEPYVRGSHEFPTNR